MIEHDSLISLFSHREAIARLHPSLTNIRRQIILHKFELIALRVFIPITVGVQFYLVRF